MAEGIRLIHNIHHIVIVCLHGKRKIIALHMLLAEEIRGRKGLGMRVITVQLSIALPQLPHGTDGRLLHIPGASIVYSSSIIVPLYLLGEGIAPLHHHIAQFYEFIQCMCFSGIGKVLFRKSTGLIQQRTIQRHNGTYREQRPGKKNIVAPYPKGACGRYIGIAASCGRRCHSPDQQRQSQCQRYTHYSHAEGQHPFPHRKGKNVHKTSISVYPNGENMPDIPAPQPRNHTRRQIYQHHQQRPYTIYFQGPMYLFLLFVSHLRPPPAAA